MSKHQKGLTVIVLVLVIVVLISVVAYYVYQDNQTKNSTGQSQPVSTQSPIADNQNLKLELRQIKIQELTEPQDRYSLTSLEIEDDVLVLNVRYSGGCEQHLFDLVWSGGFLKSLPPQVDLHLIHDANEDGCEALIAKNLRFDLTVFDTDDPLILNIYDFERERHRINYNNK